MISLIYYNMFLLGDYLDLPDIHNFEAYYRMYGPMALPIDRTGTLTFPLRTTSLFPMPGYMPCFTSYERLCDARAHDIVQHARHLDVGIDLLWSGGIDSTTALVSLLKTGTDRLTVVMNKESIWEYPLFYEKYIKGKLQTRNSGNLPNILGGPDLLVTGEHNDQLFGSDLAGRAILWLGIRETLGPFSTDFLLDFLKDCMGNRAELYLPLFERLMAAAPIPLKTNFLAIWWFNFAMKWQQVHTRTLSMAAKERRTLITQDYLDNRYLSFFNTLGFQLWSMNHTGWRIRNTWRSYKWPSKDVIYGFTKDEDYRDRKMKQGSLKYLFGDRLKWAAAIDDQLRFYDKLPFEETHQPSSLS